MAMSERHRDILRQNRIELINNVNIGQPFLSYFHKDRTLTAEMIAEIEEPPIYTRRERVAKLLDRLPSRGANAFAILVKALYDTEQEHLAALLDPDVIRPSSEISTDFIVSLIVNKTPLTVESTNNKNFMKQRGNYQTTDSANCKALIVSVCNGELKGLEEDRTIVSKLFKGLKFTVQHLTVKAEDLDTKLCEESNKLVEPSLEAFVLFILRCPGNVNKKYIEDKFDGKKCKALLGKPKLIFLQRCETPVRQKHIAAGAGDVQADGKTNTSKAPHDNNAAGAGDAQADGKTNTSKALHDNSAAGTGDVQADGKTNTSKAAHDPHNLSAFLIVEIYDKAVVNQRSLAVTALCYAFAEGARYYSITDLLIMSKIVVSKLKKREKLAETIADMVDYRTIETFHFNLEQKAAPEDKE